MALAEGNMWALVANGPYNVSVEQRPIPQLVNTTDAIVRMSSAAICGTDLHSYHGLYGSSKTGWIQGHEGLGYIDSIGDGVQYHKVGDYVVVPDHFGTGHFPDTAPTVGAAPGFGPEQSDGVDYGGCQGMKRLSPICS